MLSKECIADIKTMPVEERQEVYTQELFDRWVEIKEKELKGLPEMELREMLLDEFTDDEGMIDQELRMEIDQNNKEELIEQIVEGYEGSEDEYITWISEVYIND